MNEEAEIILIEKDRDVSFANCGLPYYIGGEIVERDKLVVASAEFLTRRFRLDVRTRQEVIRIDRKAKQLTVRCHSRDSEYDLSYDKLILSPGARPIVPPIDGADAENVFTLRNLVDTDQIKTATDTIATKRAVVVGAGFIGLEMVEQLARRGFETALVELQSQVLPLIDPEMAYPIEESLQAEGVSLHLGDGIERILVDEQNKAKGVALASGTELSADLVILGIGVRPNSELAADAELQLGSGKGIATNEFLQTNDADIYAVGDAAEYVYGPTGDAMRIALAGPANRAGRLAGEHAATGQSAPMGEVLGTSIVRVFESTAALTGVTVGLAKRLNLNVTSVTITANNHAGYYPHAHPLTLKLVYDPATGKVLGAQAVGREGVDKRVDVIATAMAMGATVRDLARLDLAYAPPFGAAKDPVHLAAFAACNQLDGVEDFESSDADLTERQVVDVRTEKEVATRPLCGAEHAVNIPLDSLRGRLAELDPKKETVVSCTVGLRAHVAVRILKQNGFDSVKNLAGGAIVRHRACRGGDRPTT
jgi:NADPH-dependent 2,4-dienoyl-CoA reductase/sulfur reductase-like enzyme/rhodanese-related sulfurtransferase